MREKVCHRKSVVEKIRNCTVEREQVKMSLMKRRQRKRNYYEESEKSSVKKKKK